MINGQEYNPANKQTTKRRLCIRLPLCKPPFQNLGRLPIYAFQSITVDMGKGHKRPSTTSAAVGRRAGCGSMSRKIQLVKVGVALPARCSRPPPRRKCCQRGPCLGNSTSVVNSHNMSPNENISAAVLVTGGASSVYSNNSGATYL